MKKGGDPSFKAEITPKTKGRVLVVHGLANVIEISFLDSTETRSTQIALQSKVDMTRWLAALEVCLTLLPSPSR